ncbi:MAG: collagen-like protein, partial [Candidatus Kapaibacterium sp.]
FTVNNTGTIDNSRGIVSALGSVGVAGTTTPMAIAGFAQTGHGIYGQSNGGGAGVYGSGSGASNGISAVTFGSGNAIEAVTPTTAADVIYAHTGGTGRAGYFQIQNAANSSNAIFATTLGSGNGIMGQITLTTSGAAGVYGETNSTAGGAVTAGSSGVLGTVTSSSNGAWSAGVRGINNSTTGSGVGVIGYQAGSGFGVYGEAPLGYGTVGRSSGGTGVLADGTGAGSNALIASYNGGTASTVAANNCAIFRNGGLNVARIDNTGKGYFNGGTQNNGADVAEAFAVEGERSTYEPGDVLVISTRSDRTVEKSSTPYSTAAVGVYATKPGVLLTDRSFDTSIDDLVPMGVVGVIPTKVSSENGEIHRGDLLVTSSTPGHAMKAGANPAVGTVIGKALENFEKDGTGIIKVLVNVK